MHYSVLMDLSCQTYLMTNGPFNHRKCLSCIVVVSIELDDIFNVHNLYKLLLLLLHVICYTVV